MRRLFQRSDLCCLNAIASFRAWPFALMVFTHTIPCRPITTAAKKKFPVLQRTRRSWSDEEVARLMKRVQEGPPTWYSLSREFDRSIPTLVQRYRLEKGDPELRGPWMPDEIDTLRRLTEGQINAENIDWVEVQANLPRSRNMSQIMQTWKHSINPVIKHGKWSDEEVDLLKSLVEKFGTENWDMVADSIGTRTRRQCLERWRWTMGDLKKGQFSAGESAAIQNAVKKYGDQNFALIQFVTGINRTPRHISQHYMYALDPKVNREPWELTEELELYNNYQELGSMAQTVAKMGTNRAAKDAWNHYRRIQRFIKQEKIEVRSDNGKITAHPKAIANEIKLGKN